MATAHEKRPAHAASPGAVFGMGSCYALGTFTDNFYKQAAVLFAAATQLTSMQSVATVLFSLPFILFSAWAGWLADRVAKKHLVVGAKIVELLALLLGAAALVQGWWPGILAVIFFMGLQATVFSPAINGSIPEHFEACRVPRVNSLIKLASTAAVLGGIAAAGFFLDLRPGSLLPDLGLDGPAFGRAAASAFIILIAVLGVAAAFSLALYPPAARPGSGPAFPWSGPVDSVRHLLDCRKDPQLFLVLVAEAYFYGIAAIAVISIANLAKQLGYTDTMASLLSADIMLGIAGGALLAGRSTADSWRRFLVPSALGLGCFLLLASCAPFLPAVPLPVVGAPALLWLFAVLFAAGVCGGIYLIPLASFIQVRPGREEKGKVLGVSNFFSFVSIAVFGALFGLISLLPASWTFAVYGAMTVCFALAALRPAMRGFSGTPGSMRDVPAGAAGLLLRAVLGLRYRIREQGLDRISVCPNSDRRSGEIPRRRPVLFLPNHPALVDPLVVYSRIAGLRPRPLADAGQMSGPVQRLVGRRLGAITIEDARGAGSAASVARSLDRVVAALRAGDNVLLYPAGRACRNGREELGANSGVARILEAVPETRVVLVRTSGLWGSRFSYASGKTPRFMSLLLSLVPALLCNLLFFMPKRIVTVEFSEPAHLPRNAGKMALNAFLEEHYNTIAAPARSVPLYFWQGTRPCELPPPPGHAAQGNADAAPEAVRTRVFALLRDAARLPGDHPVSPADALGTDLGLDSLDLMEVATALENEFGHPVPRLEPLVTAGDCVLAAAGLLFSGQEGAPAPLPRAWSALKHRPDASEPAVFPGRASTPLQAFLRHARTAPALPLVGDQSGVRTRRDVLTGALVLARRFAAWPETRLGIMLPASPAAMVVWVAAQLAGKETVMINWTVGRRNLEHCARLAGVSRVVTARALCGRLERQGTDLGNLVSRLCFLEDMTASFSLWEKLRGLIRARLFCLTGRGVRAATTLHNAVILFTSGSESLPKGVPLSQENVVANARDILEALKVRRDESVLAMLPPFHSFGFMVGVILPLCAGVPAVCHPNPTESAALVRLVRRYGLSLLGATPTFLEGMLARTQDPGDLASLRFVFAGAEKCPARVYEAFAARCPGASLCEGYGITECSPVIAVNRPERVVPSSIGLPLASLETALVDPDAVVPVRVAAGRTGLLLVRGPSVFSGYMGPAPDPFVHFEEKRWYCTGDLAAAAQDGTLFFRGRLSRFVKVGGEMVSLPQIEQVLESAFAERADLPGDGTPFLAVAAAPGSEDAGRPELVLFTRLDVTLREANAALKQNGLSGLSTLHRLVRLPALPLLGTGKTDYRALWTAGA